MTIPILVSLILCGAALLTGYVAGAAKESVEAAARNRAQRIELPQLCAQYYNDGTGRWAECMGVEPK